MVKISFSVCPLDMRVSVGFFIPAAPHARAIPQGQGPFLRHLPAARTTG
jgi:hypothetical protein